MNDYKLILVSDNTNKTQVRYRKQGDAHWSTIYVKNAEIDDIIEEVVGHLKSTYENE